MAMAGVAMVIVFLLVFVDVFKVRMFITISAAMITVLSVVVMPRTLHDAISSAVGTQEEA